MIHAKKIHPQYFAALAEGRKTFELRREDDWPYEVGDYLALNEWDPETELYTGRCMIVAITYVLRDPEMVGIGIAALGIKPCGIVLGDALANYATADPHAVPVYDMHEFFAEDNGGEAAKE